MVNVLPAKFRLSQGREVQLYRLSAAAVGSAATYSTPFPGPWKGSYTVGAGDVIQRGGIQTLAINALLSNAGSVDVLGYTEAAVLAGTVATLALGAGTAAGTAVSVGNYPYIGVQMRNGGGAGTATLSVRGRSN